MADWNPPDWLLENKNKPLFLDEAEVVSSEVREGIRQLAKTLAKWEETEMKIHHTVTLDRLQALAEDSLYGCSYPGVCLACGADVDGVEPDARRYECFACKEKQVYGAEEAFVMLA